MPVFDFVCSNPGCKEVAEKIVRTHTVDTINCPKCGSEARKPELGFVEGSKRHVGLYFNYLAD